MQLLRSPASLKMAETLRPALERDQELPFVETGLRDAFSKRRGCPEDSARCRGSATPFLLPHTQPTHDQSHCTSPPPLSARESQPPCSPQSELQGQRSVKAIPASGAAAHWWCHSGQTTVGRPGGKEKLWERAAEALLTLCRQLSSGTRWTPNRGLREKGNQLRQGGLGD